MTMIDNSAMTADRAYGPLVPPPAVVVNPSGPHAPATAPPPNAGPAGKAQHRVAAMADDPTFWLVLMLAVAVAAAHYAATGRIV